MQVFIMRHGQAEMIAKSDQVRQLTDVGRLQVQTMAQTLVHKLDSLDFVLVSPYVRAQQTWNLVSEFLPEAGKVMTLDDLTPSGDESAIVDLIDALVLEHPSANLLVVSHLPLVGYLVDGLVPGAGAPIFSTASIARLCMSSPRKLIELVHPQF